MNGVKMFLEQRKLHRLILYTIIVDVTLGYLIRDVEVLREPLPLALLYLANIVVILAVYRFWILPVFRCDDSGFTVYGISPFTRESCRWERLEYVCFKEMEEKKGRTREFLVLHYVLPNGLHKTNMVPMYMVWKRDAVKEQFLGFLKRKGIRLECQPGL